MPVLTQKEFDNIKRNAPAKPVEKVKVERVQSIKQDEVTYVLLHPERELYIPKTFESVVEIEGIKYKMNCVDGILKTTEKILSDFLITKEYQLIRKENTNGK